jgi:hypothetical protein
MPTAGMKLASGDRGDRRPFKRLPPLRRTSGRDVREEVVLVPTFN